MHPLTRAEATGWAETSQHRHVLDFLHTLHDFRDPRLVLTSFGTSPEGRDLPLVVASRSGVRDPAEARAAGLPVVFTINGIHAGEVEGKEASLMILRDWLQGKHPGLLDDLVWVIVPLFNPDGNDRIDPKNRALDLAKLEGQIGPKSGVGTRVNASGINLNRDYMRQQAPEMRLLQRGVVQPWEPHLTIDCHATNGSVHRFAATFDTPHTVDTGRPEPVAFVRERLLPGVRDGLRRRTGLETGWYGNFVEDEGGTGQGWMTYPHHPRFGSNYRGLSHRLDVLLEVYSYLPFPERVQTAYEFLIETLRWTAAHASAVSDVVQSSRAPRDRMAVRYELVAAAEPVDILTRTPRTLDGTPTSVRLPHLCDFRGTRWVDRPGAYVVPPEVADHLALHGLDARVLDGDMDAALEVARVDQLADASGRKILEAGSSEPLLDVTWRTETRRLPRGSLVVPTDQPNAGALVYLCEPESDDNLCTNGVLPLPSVGRDFGVMRWRSGDR